MLDLQLETVGFQPSFEPFRTTNTKKQRDALWVTPQWLGSLLRICILSACKHTCLRPHFCQNASHFGISCGWSAVYRALTWAMNDFGASPGRAYNNLAWDLNGEDIVFAPHDFTSLQEHSFQQTQPTPTYSSVHFVVFIEPTCLKAPGRHDRKTMTPHKNG